MPLVEVGEAAHQVHHNLHEGKVGVLCLAPARDLGVDDPEKRARIGEDRIRRVRRHSRLICGVDLRGLISEA